MPTHSGQKGLEPRLQEVLGGEYDVLLPRMPNKNNAKYLEWKIWFERMIPFLNKEIILVGYSLGASFIANISLKRICRRKFSERPCRMLYDTDIDKPMINLSYQNR